MFYWVTGEQHVVFYWVTCEWQVVFYWVTGERQVVFYSVTCEWQVMFYWVTGEWQVVFYWVTGEQQVVFYWVTGKWQVVFYWVTGQPDNIHDTELCRNYIESATLSRHTLRSIEDSNAKQTLQWRLVIKVLYCTVFAQIPRYKMTTYPDFELVH